MVAHVHMSVHFPAASATDTFEDDTLFGPDHKIIYRRAQMDWTTFLPRLPETRCGCFSNGNWSPQMAAGLGFAVKCQPENFCMLVEDILLSGQSNLGCGSFQQGFRAIPCLEPREVAIVINGNRQLVDQPVRGKSSAPCICSTPLKVHMASRMPQPLGRTHIPAVPIFRHTLCHARRSPPPSIAARRKPETLRHAVLHLRGGWRGERAGRAGPDPGACDRILSASFFGLLADRAGMDLFGAEEKEEVAGWSWCGHAPTFLEVLGVLLEAETNIKTSFGCVILLCQNLSASVVL